MRALVQRVTYGKVSVDGKITAEIGQGVVILLGIGHSDNVLQADFLSDKIVNLRIFEDAEGKMKLCLLDIKGSAILVSQFTLYADTSRGRRPSFVDAALPENARPLIAYFADKMNKLGIPTGQGIFGADMLVEIHNDGPVTIWLEK